MVERFRLQAPEELDHRGIDLGGSLLLRPVAAAGKHDGLPQLGHESFQVGDELIHPAEGDHEVTIAGDVERGNGHVRPGESCQQLPVAIDVTVPVQPAAKAGTSKFPGVELDVGLRELRREGGRFDGAAEESTLSWHHTHGVRIGEGRSGVGDVPRARVQDAANGIADVPPKLRLSHPWLLKVELIEDRVVSSE